MGLILGAALGTGYAGGDFNWLVFLLTLGPGVVGASTLYAAGAVVKALHETNRSAS